MPGQVSAQRISRKGVANPKINVHWNSVIRQIGGGEMVEYVAVEHLPTGKVKNMPLDGVFFS